MTKISLEEKAYDYIRQKMVRGQIRPGHPLRERTLAAEIGISRTPVRHAIRQLEREGLVVHKRNAGSVVKVLSRRDIQELYEVRIALEGLAIESAAKKIAPREIRKLRAMCDEFYEMIRVLKRAGWTTWDEVGEDLSRFFVRSDVAFHRFIMDVADNQRLRRVMRDLEVLAQIFQIPSQPAVRPVADVTGTWQGHRRILRQLARRDPLAARNEMARHLTTAMQGHLGRLDREEPWAVRQGAPSAVD